MILSSYLKREYILNNVVTKAISEQYLRMPVPVDASIGVAPG